MAQTPIVTKEGLTYYNNKVKTLLGSKEELGAAAEALSSSKKYTDAELQEFATEVNAAVSALTDGIDSKADTEHSHAINDVTGLQNALDSKADDSTVDSLSSTVSTHVANKSNPHGVTKAQVGLSNVNNTSDADKPVSTAQATAIADAKSAGTTAQANLETHESDTSNPHSVTKSQVGLGNVPNVTTNNQTPTFTAATTLATLTSGEKLSVSFGKIAKAITDFIAHLANKSNPHGVTAAQVGADPSGSAQAVQDNLDTLNDEFDDHTGNADIHFTAAERTKLSGIATGANKYTHPNSGVSAGTYKSVTVDAQGHVTAGSNPTTLAGYGITDAEAKGTVNTHNSATDAHSDIRLLITNLTTKVNNFLDVDDTTTDQLSEVIALIEDNRTDIESITSGKVNVSDIVNNLTTNVSNKPLSAAQGVALKALVDALDSDKVDKVSGKGLSTNDYTTDEKTKLSGIAAGAEVNQNAFSNIVVGSTTVAADSKTDSVTFVGSNVTITPDATNDKITFAVANGTTSAKGIVQLTNSTSSTSTTTAATPSSVKSAYDLANTAKTNAGNAQTTADEALEAAGTAQSTANTNATNLSSHTGNTSNPHGVTKAQVGLSNVPNVATNDQTPTFTVASANAELTSGEKLSVSLGKIAKAVSSLIAHLANTSNPHSVTKAQVGLGNVDNTADANKSVSHAETATSLTGLTASIAELNALDGITATVTELNYMDGVTSNVQTQLNAKAATSAIPTKVSQLTNDSGYKTTDNNTTYTLTKSDSTITLTGSDGSTTSVADSNTTYSAATQSAAGLMSAADKTKLDSMSAGVFDFDALIDAPGYTYTYVKSSNTHTETIKQGTTTYATRTSTKNTSTGVWTVSVVCSAAGVNVTKTYTPSSTGWTSAIA